MPARRMLTMRHLRRIMRMHHEGASAREIVRERGLDHAPGARAYQHQRSAYH